MSLHNDLLEQAIQLVEMDPRRPKQANLRRAISASYYALFHLLTSEASAVYISDFQMLARISRTYNHGEMKKVSSFFANNKLPKALQPPTGTYPIDDKLRNVAQTFVDLQQARHEADYNLALTLSRKAARDLVQRTQRAFNSWELIRKSDGARLYLACFLLWKRWDEEPR